MESKNKFRIVKVILKNQYGKKISKSFRVEIYKKFLSIPYWETITKSKHLGGTFFKVPLYFETFKDAKKHVKKLCKKNKSKLNEAKITDIETFECLKR